MTLDIDNVTEELIVLGRKKRREQTRAMHASWFGSWKWCTPEFTDQLDWMESHPRSIRKGTYLSDTPNKEVWMYSLPKRLGGETILLKRYDYTKLDFMERIGASLALTEAKNCAAFNAIGIPVPDLIACGETRRFGLLENAFIITRYLEDYCDGSVLMPRGVMHEKTELRMAFGRKTMEYIARLHQCGGSHNSMHPHKILFPKDADEHNDTQVWIDLGNCQFPSKLPMHKAIPRDLIMFFVDMRLSTDEIKQLCAYYLQFNHHCRYTLDKLWEVLTRMKPENL